jgi:replicative superfamily II helicase
MFAGKVAQFAHNVGFEDLGVLFHHFIGRIAFGARADVLPLCEIPWIQVARARILYQQGIKTVEHVAGESAERLAHILDIKPKNMAKRLAQKIIDAARELCTRRVADQQLLLQSSVFAAGTSD